MPGLFVTRIIPLFAGLGEPKHESAKDWDIEPMTPDDALALVQQGGALAASLLAIWALLTGRVVTRREFDRLDHRFTKMEELAEVANTELRRQAATNARLVEMSFAQRQEAENVRRSSRKPGGQDDG